MPVVLAPEAKPAWLGEKPADLPQLKALLAPYPSGEMTCWGFGDCQAATGSMNSRISPDADRPA